MHLPEALTYCEALTHQSPRFFQHLHALQVWVMLEALIMLRHVSSFQSSCHPSCCKACLRRQQSHSLLRAVSFLGKSQLAVCADVLVMRVVGHGSRSLLDTDAWLFTVLP